MIAGIFTPGETMMIMTAYDYSKAGHRNQERESEPKDAPIEQKRYFNHPKRIAISMIEAGLRDADTVCVILLHDCPEDTSIFGNQKTDGYYTAMDDARFRLSRAFIPQIAEDVICLTIPVVDENVAEFSSKNKCTKFYHDKMQEGSESAMIAKVGDRLDNLSTIESKKPVSAKLKLQETRDFYIPLFYSKFEKRRNHLQKLGYQKTCELELLIAKKMKLLNF